MNSSNITVSFFGDLSNGYTQYPLDYTQTIFENFIRHYKAQTQIAIHRDRELVYYAYIRKLVGKRYIGICVCVNGIAITDFSSLFSYFEECFEMMAVTGRIIHYNENAQIESDVKDFSDSKDRDFIENHLRANFGKLQRQKLPPVNYSISKDSVGTFNIADNNSSIYESSHRNGYTIIFKDRNFMSDNMNSYVNVITKLKDDNRNLRKEISKLQGNVLRLQNKQRNTALVAFFGIVAIVLGFIVWNKVLFPSEVTKKDMGEYVYYGPMKNGEPNGTGVAIYHEDDIDGRLYYYGNFTKGKRVDDNAMLFYKDGSYFKGAMEEDQWISGLFFDVENAHFIGDFKDNTPWRGDWYKHTLEQHIVNGD